jgi:hypothetical protein
MTVLSDSGVMAHCCIIGKKESMLIDNSKVCFGKEIYPGQNGKNMVMQL